MSPPLFFLKSIWLGNDQLYRSYKRSRFGENVGQRLCYTCYIGRISSGDLICNQVTAVNKVGIWTLPGFKSLYCFWFLLPDNMLWEASHGGSIIGSLVLRQDLPAKFSDSFLALATLAVMAIWEVNQWLSVPVLKAK